MDQKKLRIILKVLNNVSTSFPETAQNIEENVKEVCEREELTGKEVIVFIVFGLMVG